MFFILQAVAIGWIAGWVAERLAIARNGKLISVALGVGGAVLASLAYRFFGIGIGSGGATAAIGALALIWLAPVLRPGR